VDRSNPAAADRRARGARGPPRVIAAQSPCGRPGGRRLGRKQSQQLCPLVRDGSDRPLAVKPEMPTHGVPRDRRAALPPSPVPCHYAAARKPHIRENFSEVSRKFLRSCSEVARKFPGGVEAVQAPSCDIPLPLAMFGGRRTACAAGLHVGMGHCTGAAQTRGIPSGTSWLQARQVPQVGSPEVAHCKSDWAQPRARTWSDGEGGSATGYAPVSEAPRQHCMLLTYEKPDGGPKSQLTAPGLGSFPCAVCFTVSREADFAVESSVPGSPEAAGSDGA
jgi:hypothetical protein